MLRFLPRNKVILLLHRVWTCCLSTNPPTHSLPGAFLPRLKRPVSRNDLLLLVSNVSVTSLHSPVCLHVLQRNSYIDWKHLSNFEIYLHIFCNLFFRFLIYLNINYFFILMLFNGAFIQAVLAEIVE